jgi:hypothetical protein
MFNIYHFKMLLNSLLEVKKELTKESQDKSLTLYLV